MVEWFYMYIQILVNFEIFKLHYEAQIVSFFSQQAIYSLKWGRERFTTV